MGCNPKISGRSSKRHVLGRLPRVSVILPTMNEEGNLERFCSRLSELRQNHAYLTEAIFVLNNTTDGTAEVLMSVLRQSGNDFLRVAHSEGARGSAIRKGVEMAQGDVVVVMDSDGQYDPQQIPDLVRPILDRGYFVSIGRNHGWANVTRRIISEIYKKLTKILLGVEHVQTEFKAGMREILLDTIPKDVPGLDIDVRWMNNVVVKRYGEKLSDDVEVRVHLRLHGKTTLNPLRLSLGLLYTIVSLALERKTGRELPFPRKLKEITLQPTRYAIVQNTWFPRHLLRQ
jgi:glycosyltransferase involved in cell wall biosynthesis